MLLATKPQHISVLITEDTHGEVCASKDWQVGVRVGITCGTGSIKVTREEVRVLKASPESQTCICSETADWTFKNLL